MPAITCALEPVEIAWELGTREVIILLAQPRARYDSAAFNSRGFRHHDDEGYLAVLGGALRSMQELNAHFLVFPEYTWPFARRSELFSLATECIPPGGVCIAPFEHLSKDEFPQVLRDFPVRQELRDRELGDLAAALRDIPAGTERINACLAIVRRTDGTLEAIPQRKTRPAAMEEGGGFVPGTRRYAVRGKDCAFAMLICFDMIALDRASEERPRDILADANLNLVFAPECNPSPLHESYAHAMIDLFQNASWANHPPVIVFANTAQGTQLPEGKGQTDGFSRVIGRLGKVDAPAPPSSLVVEGVVASAKRLESLAQIEGTAEHLSVHGMSWILGRPRESLLSVRTFLDGPSSDPTTGRFQTSVRVYRWLNAWQRVRASAPLAGTRASFGVPSAWVVNGGLVGFDAVQHDFRSTLSQARTPICVLGGSGSGKTAVVATLLSQQTSDRWRVLWLDGETMGKTADALVDRILLQLGLVEGHRTPVGDQWRLIRSTLETAATVIVLDSYERWNQAVPSEFLALHGWPVRLVVTSRRQPSFAHTKLAIPRLNASEVRALMWRNAPPPTNARALETAAQGIPLACIWLADAAALPALKSGASQVERIFVSCTTGMKELEERVLQLVCTLPAPISGTEAKAILQVQSIDAAVRTLRGRHLIARRENAEADDLHTAHPLVRQFVTSGPFKHQGALDDAISAWARGRLSRDGGDRNWPGFPRLAKDWQNIRFVIDRHLDGRGKQFEVGLQMWRSADYFLWSSFRLRERLQLGNRVLEGTTRAKSMRPFIIHALRDAVAETLWHLDLQRNQKKCQELLDRAAQLSGTDARFIEEKIQVAYYRGRFLVKMKRYAEALKQIEAAKELAVHHGDVRAEGQCLNQLGNLFTRQERFRDAHRCYDEAAARVRAAGDLEMSAVVLRQRGRCWLAEGQYAQAIGELETAIAAFAQLGLDSERAEAGIYHARALADAGDKEDARVEFGDLERFFSDVGYVTRLHELADQRFAAGL